MPGKTKDCKAKKGRKALENEWDEAVKAAETGDPLIASDKNLVNRREGGDTSAVYVQQSSGGAAKDRLRRYEEQLRKAELDKADHNAGQLECTLSSLSLQPSEEGLTEKELARQKKKQEKEAARILQAKQEEDREKRRKAREEKLKNDAEDVA